MDADDVPGHPGLAAERALLAAAVDADVPVLGVCLGMQLLALALGARLHLRAATEIGFAPVDIDVEDPLLGALGTRPTVLHWHSDTVDLPPGATLLASTEVTPVQAFRAGSALGLQFHPELDAGMLDLWLATPDMVGEPRRGRDRGDPRRRRAAPARPRPRGREDVRRLRRARAGARMTDPTAGGPWGARGAGRPVRARPRLARRPRARARGPVGGATRPRCSCCSARLDALPARTGRPGRGRRPRRPAAAPLGHARPPRRADRVPGRPARAVRRRARARPRCARPSRRSGSTRPASRCSAPCRRCPSR